jgi:hypothetical protein
LRRNATRKTHSREKISFVKKKSAYLYTQAREPKKEEEKKKLDEKRGIAIFTVIGFVCRSIHILTTEQQTFLAALRSSEGFW